MKQIITEKQLDELTDKAYEKYLDWMIEKEYNQGYGRDHIVPMNIGQMIEFLSKNYNEISLGFDDSGVYWHIHVGSRGTGNMMRGFGKMYDSNEDDKDLIDALWQAVKEVLNHENKN